MSIWRDEFVVARSVGSKRWNVFWCYSFGLQREFPKATYLGPYFATHSCRLQNPRPIGFSSAVQLILTWLHGLGVAHYQMSVQNSWPVGGSTTYLCRCSFEPFLWLERRTKTTSNHFAKKTHPLAGHGIRGPDLHIAMLHQASFGSDPIQFVSKRWLEVSTFGWFKGKKGNSL